MQSHSAFEILARHVLKRTNFDDAGAVDQDVDLAEAIDDLTNSGINLCGIEQVALNGQDRRHVERDQPWRAPVRQDHVR